MNKLKSCDVTELNSAPAAHEELTLLLEDARNKVDEHWNQVLRLQAEMENLRKRAARDLESAHKFALDRFVADLLPVKDSLSWVWPRPRTALKVRCRNCAKAPS